MALTSSLFQIPVSQFKSLNLTSSFFHGSSQIPLLRKSSSSLSPVDRPPANFRPQIRAMKLMQGRVVCATNDKTVNVEVVRLAPHPKYKRRVKKIKKFQAHDPENRFKVGDLVLLERSRPISKTKMFIAVPVPPRNVRKPKEAAAPEELGLPLESQQS